MGKGRPTSYNDDYPRQACFLASFGATNSDLAEFFRVSLQTIKNWFKQHPDFLSSVKNGRGKPTKKAENTLLHRALGDIFVTEETVNKDRNGDVVSTVVKRKQLPPSVGSLIFYLKNTAPDQWRGDMKLLSDSEQATIAEDLKSLLTALNEG